jgi:hypothetical protein
MVSRGFYGDGVPNDGKGVKVVQGRVVRKGRISGFTTTSGPNLTMMKDYFSANAKPALPDATTETNTNGTRSLSDL